jgi:very-short-patch-repair endonuclease
MSRRHGSVNRNAVSYTTYNWNEIQRYYDKGHSGRKCAVRFGLNNYQWQLAKQRSLIVTRNLAEAAKISPWSDLRRKAVSDAMKDTFERHPDWHPNSRCARNKLFESYPEKRARSFLEAAKIVFKQQVKIGRYWVDFLVGSVIIEIDGERWHGKDREPYAKKRDEFLQSVGYAVIHIPASKVSSALVAQIDSALVCEAKGRWCESNRECHFSGGVA